MNMVFYTILFILGCIIGCIWREKTEKFPRDLDLKKTHRKIKPKQELISELIYIMIGGMSAVILANILNIHIEEFDISKMLIYVFAMLYISALVLIAGIDRNYSRIEKKTLAFGIISSILYMLYLCMVDLTSTHLSVIYLAIYMVLLVIDSFLLRKFAKDSYILNLLMVLTMILVFTDLKTLTYTLIMAFIAVILQIILLNMQKSRNGNKKVKINEIPVGFFVAASNIIVLFMVRAFENYII